MHLFLHVHFTRVKVKNNAMRLLRKKITIYLLNISFKRILFMLFNNLIYSMLGNFCYVCCLLVIMIS